MQANRSIKELLSKGETLEAMHGLRNLAEERNDKKTYDTLFEIEAYYRAYQKERSQGIISEDKYEIENNKILNSLLQLYQQLEGENIESIEYNQSDSKNGDIKLWSADGELINRFGFPRMDFKSVVFGPDGRSILASSEPSLSQKSQGKPLISLWSVEGKLLRTYDPEDDSGVAAVALSPDGKTIVSGGADGMVTQWAFSGEIRRRDRRGSGGINSVVFSSDNQGFLTGREDGGVELWNSTGEIRKTFVSSNSLARVGPFGLLAGQPFVNILPEEAILVSLEVRAGNQIDQFKLTYRLGKEEHEIVQGGSGGKVWPKFWINFGITKITGRAGDQLDQLQFHFADGTSTPLYGGGGGQPFSVSFTDYTPVGFFGRANSVINQLGFYGQPIRNSYKEPRKSARSEKRAK